MIVNEIFYSLQGEGFLAGLPSVFVRLAGCPLRCRWCDTKYAWSKEAGRRYSIDQIVRAVQQWPCRFVVITGGEPMVDPDLPQLAGELKAAGKHITIETVGIAYIPDMPCDLISISPKLSNSVPDDAKLAAIHKDSKLDLAVLEELINNYNYQLKFVVDSANDLPEIQELLDKIGNIDAGKVMLMPQAATRDELLAKSPMVADMCKLIGFAFSHRLQVMLWDNQKGR
jgi:7-carboxy-7-deazaguanine synthase